MNRSLAVAVTVLVAAGAVALVASTGAAADPTEIDSCTVIDESGHYVLADDVGTDQQETCIEIRTDDVVVDGNGHAVEGPGPANDSEFGQFAGVYVNGSTHDNYENVTVRDLEVTGFGTGVETGLRDFGGPSATLEDVTVRGNHDGIVHTGANMTLSNVTIEQNDGRAYLAGEAGLTDGTDVTIRDNGAGLSAYEAGVRLEDSVVADNDEHGASVGPHVSLELTDVAVTGNGDQGIAVTASGASVTMHGGTVTDNAGPGVTVRDAEADLQDVTVSGNGEDGIRSLDGTVEISNVTATDNADLELRVDDDGSASATGFHVGPSATTDFENEAISLEPIEHEALPPRTNGTAAGDGLNVSGDVDGPIDLELDVDADDETVDLWRHDGDTWETVEEDLDAADGTVETSVDRNGTYAPGSEADDSNDTDDSDDTDDTDDSDDSDDTDDTDDSDDDTPSDQDGEKDKDDDTPTQTPSDQDGEKDKDNGTETPSDCGCPSADDGQGESSPTSTDTATASPTAGGDATASPDSDEQQAEDTDADDDGTLGDGAGPGAVVAVLALLGSALLARRLE